MSYQIDLDKLLLSRHMLVIIDLYQSSLVGITWMHEIPLTFPFPQSLSFLPSTPHFLPLPSISLLLFPLLIPFYAFFIPFSPLLLLPPSNPASGLGEHCPSVQHDPEQSPGRQCDSVALELRQYIWWWQFLVTFIYRRSEISSIAWMREISTIGVSVR